jgi:cyclopropane fatty-acyl-phospholipid synthase-like methyltransferase
MPATSKPPADQHDVAPYFDDLLRRLDAGDPVTNAAYGRHVHWGYWTEPDAADGTADDYAVAAERLCRLVCDAAEIADGMRVLDVGCGFGGTIASLNERFTGLDLTGVNIDARQLERASAVVKPRSGNRIRFVHRDACKLDMSAGAFDAVLAVECIFHFDSRSAFFAGAAKALRPGGRLALSDFVPPAEALATLRQHDPGNDAATRMTYGQVNVLCPVEEYRDIANRVGMTLDAAKDITVGTMPTYTFLRDDLRSQPGKAAPVHAKATARLEIACRMGMLKYSVLSFARRADTLARAA